MLVFHPLEVVDEVRAVDAADVELEGRPPYGVFARGKQGSEEVAHRDTLGYLRGKVTHDTSR